MQDSLSIIGTAPLLTIIGFILVITVTNVITWWKLYTKAGQHGWTYLVPVYRFVIMARVAKTPEKYGWLAGIFSAATGLNTPIALVFFLGYIWAFVYILRDFMKQYDAPLIFWMYAVVLPIIAVFQVNDVKYIGTVTDKTSNKPQP